MLEPAVLGSMFGILEISWKMLKKIQERKSKFITLKYIYLYLKGMDGKVELTI